MLPRSLYHLYVCVTVPSVNTFNTNAAGNWMALSFIAEGRTLSKVWTFLHGTGGSIAAADITCSLQGADSSGNPDGTSIETRPATSVASTAWNKFEGFTTALTAGRQYFLVFKNIHATPASNWVNFRTVYGVPREVGAFGNTGRYNWGRKTSTDSGAAWSALGPSGTYAVEYSDGVMRGVPIEDAATTVAGTGIYNTREIGTRFTAPVNVKLNVRGVAMLHSGMTGAPTGTFRHRLYSTSSNFPGTEPTLLATSVDLHPTALNPQADYQFGIFSTPIELTPGVQYLATIGETTQTDASTNRYNARLVTWGNDNALRALLPHALTLGYFDTSSWSELATQFVPMALLLEPGSELVVP